MDDRLSQLAQFGMDASRAAEEQAELERAERAARERLAPPPPPVLMTAEVEVLDGLSRHRGGEYECYDPLDYAPVQPAVIRVRHHHEKEREIGRVEYLEMAEGSPARIIAVCSIDASAAAEWSQADCFVSPGTVQRDGRIVLDHLGLVAQTARVAAAAVKWAGTTFDSRYTWTRQSTPGFDVLMRAHAAIRKRPKDAAGIPITGHPELAEQPAGQRALRPGRDHPAGVLAPEYMRRNGEGGLHYSGGSGWVLRVRR
jgi:hypothetical protein